jgi:hypothetical protein
MNTQSKIVSGNSVYSKIAAVQGELAKVGISKGRRNQQQGYNFRGIDDVYAALSPLLAQHGLIIVPRVIERECIEGLTKNGTPLFRVTVKAEFDFISSEDGSIHTASTFGEAMDSADKATNKAMSAAYKYAAFMTFAIPTEGDNDADEVTHEPAPRTQAKAGNAAPRQQAPSEMPDAEWAKLSQLLTATKTPAAKLLKHFGVQNLRHLNQDQYAEAVERLNVDLAAMAAADTNQRGQTADNNFGIGAEDIPA